MKRLMFMFLATLCVVSTTAATGCAQDNRPPCATVEVDTSSPPMPGYDKSSGKDIQLLLVNVSFGEFGQADSLNVVLDGNIITLGMPPIDDDHVEMFLPKGATVVLMSSTGNMQSEKCDNTFVVR